MDETLKKELDYLDRICRDIRILDEIPVDENEKILNIAKKYYSYNISLMNLEKEDEQFFNWLNGNLTFHFFITKTDSIHTQNKLIIIAEKTKEDHIIFWDLKKETDNYTFFKSSTEESISRIFDIDKIKSIKKENVIIMNSLFNDSLSEFIKYIADKEYENAESLAIPPIELINFNSSKIRYKRYNLNEIIETVGDNQFTAELLECIYAYDNEKWFICAAGLGGVLEHLLYLVLQKNNMIDKQFPDNATYQDYVGYLGRKPIAMDKRQKTMIKNIFNIRNSVSHFNQGFTSKNQCTMMLDGIRDIFNNYYTKEFNLTDN
ncbi:hypothetical protein [Enterococcus sp. AZ102]|uniref:hypothetical protein n=1 Tax=Enterococcus sp. AZ102 TaxID=2774865 RepID=UPI003F23C9BE